MGRMALNKDQFYLTGEIITLHIIIYNSRYYWLDQYLFSLLNALQTYGKKMEIFL
ncbi:hypothetical protein XBJ2_2390035 [Xenorhabdus bovienii str. Jollieti]|uniref:Uncharacterized protein n=1 Tax=Xenorhabdus bovienii (strain SS-2004) TaxID=406818 RepID=D3V716_XENBS|nr:hypothetical protein XBJ1_4342 [Xenorhabdus bovienii SS-2004]CDH29294.1 hypothetical protein XBJ2_2390035 [Xenorhabdus bovienii str. Jollieti]